MPSLLFLELRVWNFWWIWKILLVYTTNLRIYKIFSLSQLGFQPKFHLLDVDSLESIRTFKKFLSDTYKGIDVLVNNAAIAFKVSFIIYSNYNIIL